MDTFDAIVIGTGTAGQTAAIKLAEEGYKVAIIENSDTPGGTCALHGCQAKKWFYEVTEIVARCQHLQGIGVTTPPQTDWQQILIQKNNFTAKIPDQTVNNLKGNNITYVKGKATFVDQSIIAVNNVRYTADYFVIATGAKTVQLAFNGNEHMITSDDFLELERLPQRIAFIGGGFISLEFAHFSARLGGDKGDIHILEVNDRVLGPFDGDMVEQLVEASQAEGIKFHTCVSIQAIEKNDSGYLVVLETGENLQVELVVNGAGRAPNIDSLNLNAAGVEYSKKGITVNNSMQTFRPHIFAVGDCAASLQLARVADMEAQVAAKTIIEAKDGGPPAVIDYSATPAVLFTYPQLGMLGKTEQQLKDEKIKYWRSYDTRLNWPTYRRVGLKYAAYKILVDENNHILGVHLLADNTTGMLNTFKQAMIDNTSITELHDNSIMTPYPSRESDIIYMLAPFVE
jgi:glutathione reductase (NADPH)